MYIEFINLLINISKYIYIMFVVLITLIMGIIVLTCNYACYVRVKRFLPI